VADVPACPSCGSARVDGELPCPGCGAVLRPPTDSGEVRKVVTVLFTDMTGSTVMGEQLDPESLRQVMRRFFTEMTAVLQRHAATIEKYIGDAVMAVFGHPVTHEDDALRAVRAAVEMRDALALLNAELRATWGVTLETRTGINTGEVLAASVVDSQSLVFGDVVNVAARLEQAAEPGEVLVGDSTFRMVRDALVAAPVGPLPLKGKSQPVRAWRVLELHPSISGWNRRLDSPLITRDVELRTLRDALHRVEQTSTCQVVTVMGGAGIGKSRLVAEFVSQISGETVLAQGRCVPYGEGITFRPVVEVLQQLAGITVSDNPPTATAKLAALLAGAPDAAMVTDRIKGLLAEDDAPASVQETFWALRRLVQQVAADRPVVLVLDDIQWAEPTLLDLLEYLSEWLLDTPVLLVCLARPELTEVRPGWLEGQPNSTLLRLQPLSTRGVGQLIRNLVAGAELAPEAESRIVEVAEGNPLFVEETLRMLVDEELLQLDAGRWTVTGDLTRASIPPTIHALVAARLDRLPPEERAVVERASVMGRQFWWGAVTEVSPPELAGSVGRALQSLSRRDLIRRGHSQLEGEDAFEFQHIVIRDTAYAELPKELRADLHERVAAWIARRAVSRTDEVEELTAYHWEQSYRVRLELGPMTPRTEQLGRRAAAQLTSAGRQAYTRGDMPAAVTLLTRADALLSEDDGQRLEGLPTLAFALMEVGQFERLFAVTAEAQRLAAASGDPGRAAVGTILELYIRLFTSPEHWTDEAQREARAAMDTFQRLGDERGLARGWSLLGLVHLTTGRFAAAQDAWEKSAEHAAAAGEHRDEMEALCWAMVSLWAGPATVDEGLRRATEVQERAGSDHKVRATAMFIRAAFEAARGDLLVARQLIGQARSLLQEVALTVWIAGPLAQAAGVIEQTSGDYRAAERELRQAYTTLLESGEMSWTPTVAALLGQALYAQGRFDEAFDLAERSRDMAAGEDVTTQVLWRRVAAPVHARRGQEREAEQLAREALDFAAGTDSSPLRGHAWAGQAEVMALCGRSAESAEAAAEAVGTFERRGDLRTAQTILAQLAELSR
jgi:predicted ATPase/class 3 adenylate cyclase